MVLLKSRSRDSSTAVPVLWRVCPRNRRPLQGEVFAAAQSLRAGAYYGRAAAIIRRYADSRVLRQAMLAVAASFGMWVRGALAPCASSGAR